MLLRVEALYNQHRFISLTLRTLYYIEMTLMIIGIGTTMQKFRFDTSCVTLELPPMAIIFAWVFISDAGTLLTLEYSVITPVNQTLLFILTSIRFVQGVRQYGWGMVPLIELLMRDGTWSFFLIEALLAVNGVFYFVMSYPYGPMFYCYLIAGFSFVGYRVILNLRQDNLVSSHESGELSSIVVFASAPPLAIVNTTPPRDAGIKGWCSKGTGICNPSPFGSFFAMVGLQVAPDEALLPPSPMSVAIQIVNCVGVSAIAFILWDICITMDQEVERIWSEPWTRTKILYYICRYLPVTLMASTLPAGALKPPEITYTYHDCFIWQLYQLSATMMIFLSVEFVMLLRVEALYNQHRFVCLTLRTLYYVEMILMIIGIGTSMPKFRYDTTCLAVGLPPTAIIFAYLLAGFSFIGYRVILNLRQNTTIARLESDRLTSIVVFADPPPFENTGSATLVVYTHPPFQRLRDYFSFLSINNMAAKGEGATKQGGSLGSAPRSLSIAIPSGKSTSLPTDGDSVTAHQDTTASSTHTSPTVASNSPVENMKNGGSHTSKEDILDKFKHPPADKLPNGDAPVNPTSAKYQGSLDLEAIMSCILGMKRLSTTIYSTFETFEKQTARVAGLAPAVDAAGQLRSLRDIFEIKQQERTKRLAELRSRFEEAVPQLIEEYRSKVDDLVKEVVAEEIKDRVQRELEKQLPEKLRKDVVQHERQLIEVQANLYNNEARRFNASLVSPQSLTVPLRPLLRPLPTPEQSPVYVRSPIFTPDTAVPAVPLPTP
ncbi:hypothetical protein EYR36_011108 [Pleurotus pulmonarius]|nr:hypothetical protein EYR36_011108 [Pleurotus pulmonarius]